MNKPIVPHIEEVVVASLHWIVLKVIPLVLINASTTALLSLQALDKVEKLGQVWVTGLICRMKI